MMDEQDALDDVPDPSRRAVLIVDDEATFRLSLAEGLSLLRGDTYQPVCVGSVDEALARLRERKFAALVTDIRMPGKDGLQLLLEMKRQSLRVPTLVTTAYGSPSVHAQAARSGAVRYIEKPFPLEHLIEFLDAVTSEGAPARGRALDLIEVVEMLCMGGRDMRVGVRTRDVQGSVFIRAGEIVHAEAAGRTGPDVVLELLSLPQPQISTDPGEEAPETTVNQPWRDLTEEAWRRRTLVRARSAPATFDFPTAEEAPAEAAQEPPAAPVPAPVQTPAAPAEWETAPAESDAVPPTVAPTLAVEHAAIPAQEPHPLASTGRWFWADVPPGDIIERLSLAGPVRPPALVGLDSEAQVTLLHGIDIAHRVGAALAAGPLLACVLKLPAGALLVVPSDDLHAVRAVYHGPALPERRIYGLARELRPSWHRDEGGTWGPSRRSMEAGKEGRHESL